ncbi:MAG: hypothetical protein HC888_18070, partial [Candidatus Competibacteraceae bacterium]|nr:hypothetical protein [Candidatus Competibacteraceae bacterium]
MNRTKNILLVTGLTILSSPCLFAVLHTNLFTPTDRLVLPHQKQNSCVEATFNWEHAFKVHGFQARGEDSNEKVNPLQLYQNKQDALASLKGDDITSIRGQLAQRFNINDDDGTWALFTPCADIDVDNLLFGATWHLPHHVSLGLYLPFISARMHNVRWLSTPDDRFFEQELVTEDFIQQLEAATGDNLHDWHESGIGDLALLALWDRTFPQGRQWLRSVYAHLRGGVIFPTGKHADATNILSLPLGYDGGVGLLIAGTLELKLEVGL